MPRTILNTSQIDPSIRPDMTRSSTTSNTIATGSSSFTYSSASGNIGWAVNTRIRATVNADNWEEGLITSVSNTAVTINIDKIKGSGTYSSWTLSIAGEPGIDGSGGGGASPQIFYTSLNNCYLTRKGVGATTAALTANRRFYQLVYVPTSRTFTEIVVTVTNAIASSSIRLGIRNCNQATGQPTTLIVDAGTVDSSTTGLKTLSINQTLSPGYYILELTSNSNPSIGAYSSPEGSFGTEISIAGVNPIPTLFRDVAFGALASDETSNSMSRSSTGVIVGIR